MEETEHGIDAGVKRWLLLAIIGVCILLVYDILAMAGGMGWLPQDVAFIGLYILIEILSISGLILVALGFHALYSIYNRALCRIAFFGFIIAPILLVMRILPPFFGNIWVSLAASLILLLGAIAFFDLRSEGTIPFALAFILVIIGVLADVIAYTFGGGVFPILDIALAMMIRIAGRFPMWIFVGATFAWTFSKGRAITK
ncbi:MAG: hypothetical protein ACW975_07120 [Candidatus Thorarchaeota archaeon]|jgi:hypothetical protein